MKETSPNAAILFLDTPRGACGRNHLYLTSARGRSRESLVEGFSMKARKNAVGESHVSVRRAVNQVVRGGVREGEELLVFCGFGSIDALAREALLGRMKGMLGAFDGQVVDVPADSGLTAYSPTIERFESELCGIRGIQPMHAAPGPASKRVLTTCILAIILAIGLVAYLRNKSSKPETPPDLIGDSEVVPSSGQVPYERPFKPAEWSFLRTRDWPKFGKLTSLPAEPIKSDVQDWATLVLREVDPLLHYPPGGVAQELERNENVQILCAAIRSSNGADGLDADSISNGWLGLRGNEGSTLSEFWQALNESANTSGNPASLKSLVAAWWQAGLNLATSAPGAYPLEADLKARLSAASATGRIQRPSILTELDLQRYLEIRNILEGAEFRSSILDSASGDEWTSSPWPKRFRKLEALGKDGHIKPEIKKFCLELSNAVSIYQSNQ